MNVGLSLLSASAANQVVNVLTWHIFCQPDHIKDSQDTGMLVELCGALGWEPYSMTLIRSYDA